MGGEITKTKGKERGPWFEIKCVRDVITSKEARGEDTSFEKKLLKAWSKHQGWEGIDCRMPTKSKNNRV